MPTAWAVGFTCLAGKDGRLETCMFAILVSCCRGLGGLQAFDHRHTRPNFVIRLCSSTLRSVQCQA